MQNRIENPFGAQRGGQTRSEFHASDSAQNQLRIAPESKAESLTVTAPIGSYTLSVGAHQSRFALLQRAGTIRKLETEDPPSMNVHGHRRSRHHRSARGHTPIDRQPRFDGTVYMDL